MSIQPPSVLAADAFFGISVTTFVDAKQGTVASAARPLVIGENMKCPNWKLYIPGYRFP